MRQSRTLEGGGTARVIQTENSLSSGLSTMGDAAGNTIHKAWKSKALRFGFLGAALATGGLVKIVAGTAAGTAETVADTKTGVEEGINEVTNGKGVDYNFSLPGVQVGETEVGGQTFGVTPAGEEASGTPTAGLPIESLTGGGAGELIPVDLLAQGAGAVIRFCGVVPEYGDPAVLQSQWQPVYEANQSIFAADVNNPGLDPGEQGVCPQL